MQPKESLQAFYNSYAPTHLSDLNKASLTKGFGNFNVYRRSEFTCRHHMASNRRDYYKISFIKGKGKLYYADKGIKINQNALLFSTPVIPYAWEASSPHQEGYFCVFTENFVINERTSPGLSDSPLFKIGADPVFFPDQAQQVIISGLFEQMLEEINAQYIHKYELLKSYTQLLIHQALKMQPNTRYFSNGSNASQRITRLFVELLERQFPIDSVDHILSIRSPLDFAASLSIHVNHLNRSVKEITGKTTGEILNERIVKEAKALLTYTTWNVAQIASCLGFAEPAYFNTFFKKQTTLTPGQFRHGII